MTTHFGTNLKISHRLNDRGRILEKLLLVEFFLSQIIFIYMNDKEQIDFFDTSFNKNWDEMLREISFRKKVHLLNKFELLKKETRKTLHEIIDVRNQMAHTLRQSHVFIEGVPWKEKKNAFGEEAEKCWSDLLDVYKEIWNPEEMAEYILRQLRVLRGQRNNRV